MPKQPIASHTLRSLKPATAVAAAVAVALGSTAMRDANAADASAAENQLGEVIVTAEKRESTVQATPISMSALSSDDLTSHSISTVEDLAGSVPGISMRTAGPGQTEYEMRGLTSAGGSAATVGFYIDETPLSASAVALNGRTVIDPDLFDLNHAEVLRGPQGTLYGAGSMGGTIKLVTNAPKLGTFEGATDITLSQTASGGSTNGGVSLMLNLPLGDTAALRLVGTDKYISGWIPRYVIAPGQFPYPVGFGTTCASYCTQRGDVGSAPIAKTIKGSNLERFSSGRAELLLKPNDSLSITTTLMYQKISADGYNNYQATGSSPDPYPASAGLYQPLDVQEPYSDTFKLASLVIKYDFGPAELTSASAYWDRNVTQSTDATEALQNIFGITGSTAPYANPNGFLPGLLYSENDPTTQFSQELRLTSTGDGAFQWVGGLYYANLKSGYITTNISPYISTAVNGSGNINYGGAAANSVGAIFDDNNPNTMKQSAIFGEASYKIRDDLKATLGVRFFKFDVSNTSYQCGVGTGTGNATCQTGNASGSGNNVLPRLNLSYTPSADLTVYGTIAKGSRPGGVNLPIPLPTPAQIAANPSAYNCGPGSGPVFVTQQPAYFGPDSIWSYEIGEKARFDDRRFSLNADVYYVQWKDIQQVIDLSCGYPYNANAGTAEAYGPEVEFSARIVDSLTLNVSGTLTHAEVSDPNSQAIAAGITAGTRIINVPKYSNTVSLDYENTIGDDLHFMARLAESTVGPIRDIAYYHEDLPSHTLVDARAGVMRGPWAMYLVGTNLTNKLAALTIDNTTFAWQQPTITRVSTNQPRTVGLELKYKF